ncbi:hypothetical protein A2U01_0058047, partial [Trifolium medium]|nr:hypothetical protein [Trifolium medium]
SKKPLPLSFNNKLFAGSHVPDIVISNPQGQVSGEAPTLTKASKNEVLAELMKFPRDWRKQSDQAQSEKSVWII